MTLTLENDEADKMARDLAALTGESVGAAVRIALSERLERERERREAAANRMQGMLEAAKRFAALPDVQRERGPRGQVSPSAEALLEIGRHCAALPDLDTRTADEIIGYDENGMW